MRAHWATLGWLLLALASCHSDPTEHEPTSAEATQGGDDPIYDTPDGTIGPHVGTGTPPPGEGLGPGSEEENRQASIRPQGRREGREDHA